MKKTLNEVLDVLNNGNCNLFDADWESEEFQRENPVYSIGVNTSDIDSFDCVSIRAQSTDYVRSEPKIQPEWKQFIDDLKTGKTYFWDHNDDTAQKQQYEVSSPIIQNNLVTGKTLEQVLAELDSWAGKSVDIFSCNDDLDVVPNIFAGDFKMNVPVSIYSQNEDVVVKANFPWLNTNSFENIYPSELNFKSVLSVLPVRVNSQKVKASFINGEFKLEFPKESEQMEEKKRNLL